MSSKAQNKFFVTTPIYYVNDVPHIGHAYCTIAADVLARYHRLIGDDVLFTTGTDEHGQKLEKAALERGVTPKELADEVSPRFRELWEKLNISYDDFIRTSEDRHKKTVNELFKIIYDKGDIYLGKYSGLYCRPCETYWTDSQAENNKCPECGRDLELLEEESFFLKQSSYADKLLKYIEENPTFIMPQSRRNEVINLIKQGLPDLSISRVTCQWGIPVPKEINDKESSQQHFIYVWFEALINYLTVAGGFVDQKKFNKYWPADVHLVGKDIVKFHAITWPIMHMAAGLNIPKMIYGHGFLTVGGEKISKSKGNALAIEPLIEIFGVDAVRYFLMREISFGNDGTVSIEALTNRYNSDLANDIGNLLSRTITMTEKYCGGLVPAVDKNHFGSDDIAASELPMLLEGKELWKKLSYSLILETIWGVISNLNKAIEESAPWKLFKEGKQTEVEKVLYKLLENLRIIAVLIKPFMPETGAKMLVQLGCNPEDTNTQWGELPAGQKVTKGDALFPRIVETVTEQK
ncbi:MAG: methionine--tRNA ligase [Candidatus Margulisiibacteriota bacterium]